MAYPIRKQTTYGSVGIENLGNTCFINSVLQCLLSTKPLVRYFLERRCLREQKELNCINKNCVVKSLFRIFNDLWDTERLTFCLNAGEVRSAVIDFSKRFNGFGQHDAQEFLKFLLEGLHECTNRVSNNSLNIVNAGQDQGDRGSNPGPEAAWQKYLEKDNSIVVDIFGGLLRSVLNCKTCNSKSISFEPFSDLSVPIPIDIVSNEMNLYDCLDLFTKTENLEGGEMPTCCKCKSKQPSTKTISIQRFPKVLIIHLKKFCGSVLTCKVDVQIRTPIEGLNMQKYSADFAEANMYSLFAVACHRGIIYCGHYTAYSRNPFSGAWSAFDDASVVPATKNEAANDKNSYILFFEKIE